jgi:hypothetical protein
MADLRWGLTLPFAGGITTLVLTAIAQAEEIGELLEALAP